MVNYDTFLPGVLKNSLYLYPTDASKVISVCNTLKNKRSSGHDEIVSWIAKTSIDTVAEPLAEITFKLFLRNW